MNACAIVHLVIEYMAVFVQGSAIVIQLHVKVLKASLILKNLEKCYVASSLCLDVLAI
jgi:hypothetical protein